MLRQLTTQTLPLTDVRKKICRIHAECLRGAEAGVYGYLFPSLSSSRELPTLIPYFFKCLTCSQTKFRDKPFYLTGCIFKNVGEVISADLATGLPASLWNNHHLAMFADHFSSYIWSCPLSNKSDVIPLIPKFTALVEKASSHYRHVSEN